MNGSGLGNLSKHKGGHEKVGDEKVFHGERRSEFRTLHGEFR